MTFAAPRPRYGGVLRHGIFQKSINFDFVDVLNFAELQIASAVFEGLVKYDANGRIVPAVASEWNTSGDGRVWTFIIAKEAKFHNGKSITASDVKVAIQRVVKKMRPKSDYPSFVDKIAVTDEHTLQVNLAKSEPDFLHWLMLPQAWIVPVDEVDKESFRMNPVGTGPFKISEQKPSEIKLIANNEYPWGKPFLDELIFQYYDSLQTARFDFESGMLDSLHIPVADAIAMEIKRKPSNPRHNTSEPVCSPVELRGVNIVAEEQGRQLLKKESAELVYLQLNPDTFKNKRWQDVLRYAIDVQSILRFQYGFPETGYLRVRKRSGTPVWLSKNSVAVSPNIFVYNPTKARRMLKSSGWQSDKKLNFIVASLSDNTGNAVALRIQGHLLSIGMNTAISHTEQAEFRKAVRDGNFDLALLSVPLLRGNIGYRNSGYPPEPALLLYQLPSYILRQSDIYGVNVMLGGLIQFENVWLKRMPFQRQSGKP